LETFEKSHILFLRLSKQGVGAEISNLWVLGQRHSFCATLGYFYYFIILARFLIWKQFRVF
jgi:hypothetical protein